MWHFTQLQCIDNMDKFEFDIISPDFVFNQISNFSNKKSPGIDGLQIRFYKAGSSNNLYTYFTCLYAIYPCKLQNFLPTGNKQESLLFLNLEINRMFIIIDQFLYYLLFQK